MNIQIRGDRDSSEVVVLVAVTRREIEALLGAEELPKVLAKTHPAYDVLVKPNLALWAEADDGTVVLTIADEFPATEEDREHRTSEATADKST